MEILFVSHKYPPTIGGMEKQSYELINGMKKHAVVHSIIYEGKGSRLAFFLTLERKILRKLREYPGITIIHFNEGLIAACSLRHKSYDHLARTATLHGLDVIFPNKIYQRYILPAFNRFQLIVAVSRATAEACIARGIHPEKVVVVNNGVDHELAQSAGGASWEDVCRRLEIPADGRRIFVAMGRPVKRKGISWFIKHVGPLLDPGCMLLIIGPFRTVKPLSGYLLGILPPGLRKQAELLLAVRTDENPIRTLVKSNSGWVKHLGRLPNDDIPPLLSNADAFIMPNIPTGNDMEGFGLVCLEASLCGAPVFAARLEGITDAIHHEKNGTLLPAGDEIAWSQALNQSFSDPHTLAAKKSAAKNYTIETFSWEKMTAEYTSCFANLRRPDAIA